MLKRTKWIICILYLISFAVPVEILNNFIPNHASGLSEPQSMLDILNLQHGFIINIVILIFLLTVLLNQVIFKNKMYDMLLLIGISVVTFTMTYLCWNGYNASFVTDILPFYKPFYTLDYYNINYVNVICMIMLSVIKGVYLFTVKENV